MEKTVCVRLDFNEETGLLDYDKFKNDIVKTNNIRILDLSNNDLIDTKLLTLSEIIKNNVSQLKDLKLLDLNKNFLNNDFVNYIKTLTELLPKTKIDISGNGFSLKYLFKYCDAEKLSIENIIIFRPGHLEFFDQLSNVFSPFSSEKIYQNHIKYYNDEFIKNHLERHRQKMIKEQEEQDNQSLKNLIFMILISQSSDIEFNDK